MYGRARETEPGAEYDHDLAGPGDDVDAMRMAAMARRSQAADVRGAQPATTGADTEPAANPAGTLEIERGALTTHGEGDDALTSFLHWPNTSSSGVTLCKGYDIGSRTREEVMTDLTEAGMGHAQASEIAEGVGLKGQDAKVFVDEHKESVGRIAIPVQRALLADMMTTYSAKARDTATNTVAEGSNRNAAGRERKEGVAAGTYVMTIEQWDGLHPAMVEFLTDLIYQGGYYGFDRVAKLNTALKSNHGDHLAQFKAVRELFTNGYMDTYAGAIGEGRARAGTEEEFFGQNMEFGGGYRRNTIRLAYLNHVIAALEAGKTVQMTSSASGQTPAAEDGAEVVIAPDLPDGQASGGPVAPPPQPTTYVVKRGEGLNQLSSKLGVSVADLIAANGDKLKTWGTVRGFEAGATIVVPSHGDAATGGAGTGGASAGAVEGGAVEGGTTSGGTTGASPESATPETPAPETSTPEVPAGAEIQANVGAGGDNIARDVKIVQAHLIRLGYLQEGPEVAAARAAPDEAVLTDLGATITAIKQYQEFGLGTAGPDGRVDAGGRTWGQMTGRIAMIEEYGEHTIGTEPIDPVLTSSQWVSQFVSDPDKNGDGRGLRESEKAYAGKNNNVCCWDAAQVMTLKAGGSISHEVTSRIPTLLQQNGETNVLEGQAELGVKYIDAQLEAGKPVMIGVDDGRVKAYNADATTEHFIVIVGKVVENGEVYYRYFDPGTRWGSKGYSEENRLHLGADNSLSGASYSGSKTYTMSQVRQNS